MLPDVEGKTRAGMIDREGVFFCLPCSFFATGESVHVAMSVDAAIRVIILFLSAAVMCAGLLMITGVFVPRNLPDEYGWVFGSVILLYGAYRFSVTFFRNRKR
jgi:prolipoprotein diacylglyceryltransferase